MLPRLALLVVAACALATCAPRTPPAPLLSLAPPPELHVMISGGLTAAYEALGPEIERTTGRTLVTTHGASMGAASDSIPARLARGEPADVVILADSALAQLVAEHRVAPDTTPLARSTIGVCVRAGAPHPDIRTADALKQSLLDAGSIAYSASASGRYVSTELFARLGIADVVRDKSREIQSERVGTVVARGDAEIGFQQVSELLPIPGIDFLGPLPPEVQKVTLFSGGVLLGAHDPEGARALLRFLASPAASEALTRSGLEPLVAAPNGG